MNPSTFDSTKLHPLTKTLLEKRGLTNEKEIQDFLFPSYEDHVGDPFEIYGMKEAVERIMKAIQSDEKIAIYSDYDCDGVPGGVLLREFFDTIGSPVEMYIPHRHNEGYGIHNHAIDALKQKGVTLIITVDSGIANIEEVAYAKSVGVDFIVTDHHLPLTAGGDLTEKVQTSHKKSQKPKAKSSKPAQVVPDAVAVINSKQDLCTYHDDMLCGCAVAWKLSCAIVATLREATIALASFPDGKTARQRTTDRYNTVLELVAKLPIGHEKWMLDLVAISTIADMVPLVKENRALAHFGLRVLRRTRRPGLLHIFNEGRTILSTITEDDIAFTVAPRVNAASRMGDPIQAHMMLYEKDKDAAEGYARDLELLNTQRKNEVKDIISDISFDHDVYTNDVVVVGDMSWGPGILGLIAQKIIDETGKPVFVWGQGEDKIEVKGSCRSRGDISVVDLMAHVGHDVFTHWGGHEQAGGFSVHVDRISALSDGLNESINHIEKKQLDEQMAVPDATITLDDIHEVTYKAIEVLAPFGVGNPKPLFELQNLVPLATKWFGKKSEHFEVMYQSAGGKKVKAIQFFAPRTIEEKVNKEHTLHAHLEKSYFGGKVELRLRVVAVI